MPSFMMQLKYTGETMNALMKRPTDRTEVIRKLMDKLGGSLVGAWYSFGEYDAVIVVDLPDNVSAAACAVAVAASGGFKTTTTPLIGMEEGMAAMKMAGKLNYKPPTKK